MHDDRWWVDLTRRFRHWNDEFERCWHWAAQSESVWRFLQPDTAGCLQTLAGQLRTLLDDVEAAARAYDREPDMAQRLAVSRANCNPWKMTPRPVPRAATVGSLMNRLGDNVRAPWRQCLNAVKEARSGYELLAAAGHRRAAEALAGLLDVCSELEALRPLHRTRPAAAYAVGG